MNRCPGEPYEYCYIARPELRQTGNGYEKQCPVCGRTFDETPPPEKHTAEGNQQILNRISGRWVGP